MRVLKAPANYDWDGVTTAIVQSVDLSLPDEPIAGSPQEITRVAAIPSEEQCGTT
ncbi:MAG TPA: hypothetical protein VN828_20750 [Acidobacteriaceae bacterium]|nr:hypothetical protein [Acidobacteriaceae bacterium]